MNIEKLSDWLDEKVKSFLEETVDTIVGHHQDALQTNEDYRGRQLLELLQNADDAFDECNDEHKAYIELTETQLIIKNTGIGFSREGVESLLTSNLSPKDNNYIGNKGLGFRSILNWAKKIHIFSQSKEKEGIWSFSFSREYAKERFDSLSNEKKVLARKKAQNKEEYPIATLRCPKWDTLDENEIYYTTVITLDLKTFANEEIKQQFEKINENILVFLPYLSEIKIVYDEQKIVYKKIINEIDSNTHEVIVEKYNSDDTTLKQWTVHSLKGKIKVESEDDYGIKQTEQKDYHLAVAYQDDLSDIENHLFSFFSTQVPLHIPALVHGTFDLEGNRNKISDTPSNKILLEKLADLLVKTAQYIANEKEIASWLPLSLIYLEKEPDERLCKLEFYKYLSQQIEDSRLFPCHDEKYRTLAGTRLLNHGDNFYIHKKICEILPYKKFNILDNLLFYTEDKKNHKLIKEKYELFINDDDVSVELNKVSTLLSENERVEIIYFISKFNKCYGDEYLELFVDNENKPLATNIAVYTPKTKHTLQFEIPKYINLRFMSQSLYDKLIEKFSSDFRAGIEADSRKLQALLKDFLNVHSYEPDTVIRRIISGTDDTDTFQIKEMIKSLYMAFVSADEKPSALAVERVPLIDKNQNIKYAKELYLGSPYVHGEFIESIYQDIDVNYMAPPTDLNLEGKSSLESFFDWLGVNIYIKLKDISIRNNDAHPYVEWFRNHTNYDFKHRAEFNLDAISIEHLSEVFQKNNLEDILFWLDLSDGLDKMKTKSIRFLEGSSRTNKTTCNELDQKNYSYFQWKIKGLIPTNSGIKSSSLNCVLPDLNLDLSPVLETIAIDYQRVEELGIERGNAKDLLHRIGVYRDFDDISNKRIESILKNLHKLNPEGTQAKKIYRLVLKKYGDYKEENLIGRVPQCNDIQVYCTKGKEKSYYPSSKGFYLNEFIYPKAILQNYPLIDIGIRQGQAKIKHIFGVDTLKDLEIELNVKESNENYLNIQEDIDSVKPFVLALRLKQLEGKDQSKISHALRDMKVKLMSVLAVTLEGKTVILDEFDYIYDSNIFYISTTCSSLDELRKNIKYIDLVPILFSTVLKVTSDEGKYKEIYKDKYNRKHILDSHTEYEAERYLDEAKIQLNIRSHKLEFWNDIARLYEKEESVTEATNINNFFQLDIDVNAINYDNLSAELNYDIFKKIFGNKITLTQFNTKSTLKIDFVDDHERRLFSERDKVKKIYKAYIWNQLNDGPVEEQSTLQQKWDAYDMIEFPNIENDFTFNIKEYFAKCLLEKTNVSLTELSSAEEAKYEEYYFLFRKDKDEALLEQLWKNIDENLSYFEQNHNELNEKYNSLKIEIVTNKDTIVQKSYSPEFMEGTSSLPDNYPILKSTTGSRKSHINLGLGGGTREREITGFKGEEIVYNYLMKKYSNVRWVSEYAKQAGVNADGRDGDGYDMTYWDTNTQYFVEVKSTKTNNDRNIISFHMTKNEYSVALRERKYYKIFYVTSVEKGIPKIRSFSFNDNNTQKVIDNYIMTTKIV